jgi:polyribonucleotide nucleotidyltransferase
VEILPGTDGLLHVSEMAHHRVKDVRSEVKEGDQILVKVVSIDPSGKIRLSRKALIEEAQGGQAGDGGGESGSQGQGQGGQGQGHSQHGDHGRPRENRGEYRGHREHRGGDRPHRDRDHARGGHRGR